MLLMMTFCTCTLAAPPAPSARQAALADARNQLVGVLTDLPVLERAKLPELLIPDADAEIERLAALAAPIGEPLVYPDGVTEVIIALDPVAISKSLKAALARRKLAQPAIDKAVHSLERADLPEQLTVAGLANPPVDATRARRLTTRDLLWASASLEAKHQLLDAARALPLADRRHVGDVLDAEPGLETAVVGAVPETCLRLVEREGMTRAVATITSEEMLSLIYAAQIDAAGPEKESVIDPPRLTAAAPKTITGCGQGVLPSAALLDRLNVLIVSSPASWIEACWTGGGTATIEGGPQSKPATKKAIAAAEFDAKTALARRMEELPIGDGRMLRDVLKDRPDLGKQMDTFMRGCRTIGSPTIDRGRVSVIVRRPLRRLWDIISTTKPEELQP